MPGTGGLEIADRIDFERARGSLACCERAAILESAPGFGAMGRYCILAARPRATFQITGSRWHFEADAPFAPPSPALEPFEALRTLLPQTGRESGVDAAANPIFQGGWIGYLGYDLAPLIERVPRRHASMASLPDAHLAYYDTFLIHDRVTDRTKLGTSDPFREGAHAREDRTSRFLELLSQSPLPDDGGSLIAGEMESDFAEASYRASVERVIEYLRAGDIFQANLSQEFSARLSADAGTLFRRAMRQSPAPFGALIREKDWSVVSTSPERFLLLCPDRRVETRPIKGTRPRGRDPVHDLLLRDELARASKDAAELTMIVDLERNDLGRVCEFGSVRVTDHRRIESYAQVHHAVSIVEGRLRAECDFVDLLRATFPGGSITGAPKIRAMEIIDELERGRRGVYTGAIGYISDHGRADFNIAIRTMIVDGERVSFRVGGGIVVDSDPLLEYRETLAKGQGLFRTLRGRES